MKLFHRPPPTPARRRRTPHRIAGALLATAVVGSTAVPAMGVTPDVQGPADHPRQAPVVGAYYTGFNNDDYPVSAIPTDGVTHVFYSFANIDDQGHCYMAPSYDVEEDFAALKDMKERSPETKVLISIGGWGADGFSDAALTKQSRQEFVSSCIDLFFEEYQGSFDGVDLDWEFPVYGGPEKNTDRPQDRRNMTKLALEFRHQLDRLGHQRGQDHLVTAALPTGRIQTDGPYDPAKSFELRKLGHILDFINVMTYDMGTGFSDVATFNAPLREVDADPLSNPMKRWNNVTAAVEYYERHGVRPSEMVLGVPFHTRGFRTTSDDDAGLYQPYSETLPSPDWEGVQADLLTDPRFEQHWNDEAQAPWLFDPETNEFYSYENTRSIGAKARFAKTHGLRGTFMWEITGDDDQHSLTAAMAAPFTSRR